MEGWKGKTPVTAHALTCLVRLPPRLYTDLLTVARAREMTLAEALREAIRLYLEQAGAFGDRSPYLILPPEHERKQHTVDVRLSPALARALARAAHRQGLSRSEIVRQAIALYVLLHARYGRLALLEPVGEGEEP